MIKQTQVKAPDDPGLSIRSTLEYVHAAIQDAWSDTRAQIQEYGFSPAVAHTAFGQLLVHNVRNRISRIIPHHLNVDAALVPNRIGSAYHVRVNISGEMFLTVSTVRNDRSYPRYARFRADYINGFQSHFRIVDGRFEAEPPLRSTAEYLQILHGPKEGNRHELGFIVVAFPDRHGQYRRPHMPLDSYLATLSPAGLMSTSSTTQTATGVEKIEDTINIHAKNQEGDGHDGGKPRIRGKQAEGGQRSPPGDRSKPCVAD